MQGRSLDYLVVYDTDFLPDLFWVRFRTLRTDVDWANTLSQAGAIAGQIGL